ncbi:MAG: extracellular solute-binding protein [Chloroflexota bacterium]
MRRLISLIVLPLLVAVLIIGCGGSDGPVHTVPTPLKEVKVAYDPNKARLFEDLLNAYNAGAAVKVRGVKMEIPQMVEAVPGGDLVAVSPDSAIWLESFDQAWQSSHPGASSIVGTTVRYATTPVVIATWRGRESELGARSERGWASLLQRASQDTHYRWSHGSPRASASGMLALVAEFYAGANKTYGLTKADADRQEVRDYVAKIEKTIARYGGESDAALVEYLLKEGQSALSAMVMPEASVFDFNRRSRGSKLEAIHPVEGTLMLDHPLVLLETAALTPEQRRAFLEFARFLSGPEAQEVVVRNGYRPVDLAFDMSKSPLRSEGMSVEQPRLMQMPATGTLSYLRVAWASGLKRRANIILVADISGSMEGEKLKRAQEAMVSFIKQIPSDEERVGLIAFATDIEAVVPLDRLGDNRQRLLAQIEDLAPTGKTAFFYATWRAHQMLVELGDTERINVVVAMTDGKENASASFSQRNIPGVGLVPRIVGGSASDAGPLVEAMKQSRPSVLVFAVAYGADAELDVLKSMVSPFGGQAYNAEPDTIRRLYELISQNF